MPYRKSFVRALGYTLAAWTAAPFGAPTAFAADVIHPGTSAWIQAARTGRADLLVLGDSVVWHNNNGWDAGFNVALSETVGLAGTGLYTGLGGVEGYQGEIYPHSGWSQDPARVPAGLAGYNVYGVASSIGPAAADGRRLYFAGVDPNVIRSGPDGYAWTLYAAGTGRAGGGYAESRRTLEHYAPLPDLSVRTPAGGGLSRLTIPLPDPAGTNVRTTDLRNFYLSGSSDMTLFYSRVAGRGATGATVSAIGYGGRATRDLYNDIWLALSPAGRRAYLDALVDDGTGKLNVLIAEGLNDRNDTRTSADGVNPGNSAAGFTANVRALVESIRAEWAAAGNAPTDLSFTLLSMFQDAAEPADGTGPLRRFGDALERYAAGDLQISYVDLWDKAGTYQDGVSKGYFFDGSHPSLTGAVEYSRLIVDAMMATPVPEPGVAGVAVAAATAGLLGRRRR